MGVKIERIHHGMNVGERGLTELFIFARWRKLSAEANRRLGRLKRRKRHDRLVTRHQNKIKINLVERFVKQSRPFPLSLLSTVALPWQTSGRYIEAFSSIRNKNKWNLQITTI